MQVAGKLALAAGGFALGGIAMSQLTGLGDRRTERRLELVRRETDIAADDWQAWKHDLDREFPGRRLVTEGDHVRFEQFLREHPAPAWIDVQHEPYTSVHVHTDGFLTEDSRQHGFDADPGGSQLGFGAPIAIAGLAGVGYVATVTGASLRATLGHCLGAGAIAGLGAFVVLHGVQELRRGDTADATAQQLVDDVNTST